MFKAIKTLGEKIKFMFNGSNDEKFVFESNITIPFDDLQEDEIEEKFIDAVELANIDLNSKKDISGLRRLSNIEKYYVYTSIVEKEKWYLVRILLKTKKPRIRKKLVKRLLG